MKLFSAGVGALILGALVVAGYSGYGHHSGHQAISYSVVTKHNEPHGHKHNYGDYREHDHYYDHSEHHTNHLGHENLGNHHEYQLHHQAEHQVEHQVAHQVEHQVEPQVEHQVEHHVQHQVAHQVEHQVAHHVQHQVAHHGYNGHKDQYQDKHYKHYEHQDKHNHHDHAMYEFKYGVKDPKTGDIKQQWEYRDGDTVKGGYAFKEADGTTRLVRYTSDSKNGFQATVYKIGRAHTDHISHHGYHH